MKFLFLSPVVWNFYPLQNQNLAASISEKDNKVIYIEPVKYKLWQQNIRFTNLSKNKKPENVSVIERKIILSKSVLSFIYENFSNTRQIVNHKPDVVISYDHLMSFLPCLYCYFAKIKFLFNVSDDWDNVPQDKKALWVWKIIIKPIVVRFSHGIVSISHKQFALYSKKNINTFILPNGVNTLFIEKINSFKENNEDNTVNFIANLRDWYDFDLLFDIFEELPQLQLNIFGTGPLYNILSQKAEIHKNICLMGNVSQEKTVQLLKESVIGIIPLKNNTLNDSTSPVKLFDYWAAQKAVVATPTYELQSIGADCILFAQTKEEWIKQIRFLTDNPKRRKFMGETGYDKVTDCYNYDEISRKFLEKIS